MFNTIFLGRLTALGDTKKEVSVMKKFTITHISTEGIQDFLQSWDDKFGTSMRSHFITDTEVEWDKMEFPKAIQSLKLNFDGMILVVALAKIKVTHKESTFRYELLFEKSYDPEQDKIFSSYWNYKHIPEGAKTTKEVAKDFVIKITREYAEDVQNTE
jgi:hypothetical protein